MKRPTPTVLCVSSSSANFESEKLKHMLKKNKEKCIPKTRTHHDKGMDNSTCPHSSAIKKEEEIFQPTQIYSSQKESSDSNFQQKSHVFNEEFTASLKSNHMKNCRYSPNFQSSSQEILALNSSHQERLYSLSEFEKNALLSKRTVSLEETLDDDTTTATVIIDNKTDFNSLYHSSTLSFPTTNHSPSRTVTATVQNNRKRRKRYFTIGDLKNGLRKGFSSIDDIGNSYNDKIYKLMQTEIANQRILNKYAEERFKSKIRFMEEKHAKEIEELKKDFTTNF